MIGHARGVHFSNDAGATWQSLATNMPTIPTRSVVFEPSTNALVVGTYARGAWILDDVSPLETLTPAGIQKPALLVGVTRGRQWNLSSLGPTYGAGEFYAPNPEFDPVISYYVRDAAAGAATITISDAGGRVVRTLRGPVGAGTQSRDVGHAHGISVALRRGGAAGDPSPGAAAAVAVEAAAVAGRRGGRGGADVGPLVLPGKYSVAITIPGIAATAARKRSVSKPIRWTPTSPSAERRERQDLLLAFTSCSDRWPRSGAPRKRSAARATRSARRWARPAAVEAAAADGDC